MAISVRPQSASEHCVAIEQQLVRGDGRRDVASRERRKTRRVHIADVALKRNRLTITVNQKNGAGGAFDAKPRENGFDPVKLLFVNTKRCFH